MRTTVTLEHDVELLVRDEMVRGGKGFKEVINASLRRALKGGASEPSFEITPFALGLRSGFDPAAMHDIDAELQADEFLRKTKSLELAAAGYVAEPVQAPISEDKE